MLQDVVTKKALRPANNGKFANWLVEAYQYQYGAPDVTQLSRTVYYYLSIRGPDTVLRTRMHKIARSRIRYGFLTIHTILVREGWGINRKKAYRVYCEEGLNLRAKRPRRRVAGRIAWNDLSSPREISAGVWAL